MRHQTDHQLFPESTIKLTKRFVLEVDTDGAEIAEAFGIEGGHVLTIADDLELPTDYTILYITGESGSGKTSLLTDLVDVVEPSIPATPLYSWGPTVEETIGVLSLVGLGDATLFVSCYGQLSDSQKARARLAASILQDCQHIVVDEFLSTLDRKTAKAVAYTFGKAVRRLGLRATVVTAHDDLGPYLRPDVVVRGHAFPSRFVVERPTWPDANPIITALTLSYQDKKFYRSLRLGELHYKGKYTGGTKEFLAAHLGNECVGVLVSVHRIHDGGRRIARVVVHPSYRGCGVGVALVKKYIADFPGADVVAVMASYNPVFERAGMSRVGDSVAPSPKGLRSAMVALGFDSGRWHEKSYCHSFMQEPSARESLAAFSGHATRLICPGGKRLDSDGVADKIRIDQATAGRVLWSLRDRRLAKFTS